MPVIEKVNNIKNNFKDKEGKGIKINKFAVSESF